MGFNPFVGSGNGGGGSGTDNYNLLSNKPKVNGVELKGNKSLVDLGILFGSSLVAEIDSSTYIVTLTLKDQEGNTLGEPQSLDLPLESVVVGGRYDDTTKKVILTLQNGNTVEFSVADLVAGLQSELSSTNKLNPEFINYNSTHRAVSDTEKSTWNGKQNALTFDNTPTNGSSNPVKSGGVYTALANKVDKVAGKDLSTNDFTNEYKSQIETNTEGIGAVAHRGSKNIVDIQKPTTVTRTDYTVLTNGGVELSCTNAQWTSYAIADIGVESGKTYVIKFLLDESSGTNDFYFFLRENASSGSNLATKNYGSTTGEYVAEFTPTTDIAWLGIYLNNSATAHTATAKVRCMITPKALYDADPTYVPYAPTNRELFENKADRTEVATIANVGAKNVLNVTATSKEVNGITFTVNDDNSVTINGTATARAQFQLAPSAPMPNLQGYVLNGAVVNDSGAAIKFQYSASPWTSFANDSGNGAVIGNYNNANSIAVFIDVPSGATVDNLVFKPMIRNPNIEDDSYQPYAMSNRELTAKEQINENNISLNTQYSGGRNIGNFAYYGLNPDQSIAAGTITYTENNGVFTFTGAADSSKNYACYLLKKQLIKAGSYVVSGISGGSKSTYWFRIGTGISDTFKMNVTDSGTTLILDSDTKITVQLVVKAGVSLGNKVFSPMIITATDWANSHDFQQYGESNAHLSSIIQADTDNMTEFKFAKLNELSNSVHFKYGFLIGGGGQSTPNKVMFWHIFVNTVGTVYFTKIFGDDTITLTGSIADGVLTITSSATIYGGLRLIWLG